jgi:putative transcriptional regulator
MSESNIVRARRLSDGTVVEELPDGSTRPLPDRTDWARLEAMTEEEIEANALSDPDNPPLTAEELARMRRVPNPRRIRERLKLTQEQFAEKFEIPLGTLRDWEQGVSLPDRAARTLLRVIEQDPEAVINALARTYLLPVPASPDSRS